MKQIDPNKQEHSKPYAAERILIDNEHRYLSLIHLYLDGSIDAVTFRQRFLRRWAEEREGLWRTAQVASCRYSPTLPRLLDRVYTVCVTKGDNNDMHRQVLNLRDSYRSAKSGNDDSILASTPRLSLFERPLPAGWVYPCTLSDLRQQIAIVPEQDLEGLMAVGLVVPDREHRDCVGTYQCWSGRRMLPVIHLYAWPIPLSFKAERAYSIGKIERLWAVELQYGMRMERLGSQLWCRWEPDCLRHYIAEHVLLHEIGHHVQRRQRTRAGLSRFPGDVACEQFADDYALRMVRHRKEDCGQEGFSE